MGVRYKSDGKVLGMLALLATGVLFFISNDSYTHDLFNKADSAWFFICGKAWMNGLVPYVDFADSKGPLLWLIYGVGYLLSRQDFIGVFWLSCGCYAATLYVAFLTAELLTADRRKAFLTAVVMLLFFFFPAIHNEVRCEDFASLFVMLAVYEACCLSLGRRGHRIRRWMVLGFCLGAVAMMKFSIALLPALAMAAAASARLRHRTSRKWSLLAVLGGMAVAVLPFFVYFWAKGALDSFIHEYFINTVRITPVGVKPYYFSAVMPLMVVPLALLARRITMPPARKIDVVLVAGVVIFTVLSNLWIHDLRHPEYGDFFTQDNVGRREFYDYEYVISQINKPRIVSMGGYMGLGTTCEALPACRYWARQSGATEEMLAMQVECCRRMEADFVIVHTDLPEMMVEMRKIGYHELDRSTQWYPFVLYSKRQLSLPSAGYHKSNKDVLLKK